MKIEDPLPRETSANNHSTSRGNLLPIILIISAVNFCLCLVRVALVGKFYNDFLDGNNDEGSQAWGRTNGATYFLFEITPTACMVGATSAMMGFLHCKEWNASSRMVAIGLGILALNFDLLAIGFGIKQWQIDANNEDDSDDWFGISDGFDSLGGVSHFIGVAALVQVITEAIYFCLVLVTVVVPGSNKNGEQSSRNAPKEPGDTYEDEV